MHAAYIYSMESVLHFVCVDSVLLLNGSFVQSASSVRYPADEPLFVTVLPLDATYLPYTAEILGGKAVSNQNLALCCDMGNNHYYIELKPRSAYVYAQSRFRTAAPSIATVPAQLLDFVKSGNYAAARSMMTGELNESITDEALADFFEGVLAIRENVYTPARGYLLIKDDGTAPLCDIEIRNGRIENIVV